ncbi:MAG: GntR family transcriptional regulator [Clostridia bacterium]|nr:GntR family transcriptional regulator [Clostridia bacterium]
MNHKTVSLADQVFERLENDILLGKYPRGSYLTEHALVEDLGVSRTPIRESLRRLEQEHIIEVSSRGILVLGVTLDDLADIYAMRLQLEPMVVARAAAVATDEEIAELRETLELQQYYVGRHDSDRIKFMDSKFHELLYRASHSTVFYDTLLPLHKKVQKFRKASVENESRADRSFAEHRAILSAIEARDADAAYAAMRAHVENAKMHIVK